MRVASLPVALLLLILGPVGNLLALSNKPAGPVVHVWETRGDRSALLTAGRDLKFGTNERAAPLSISIQPGTQGQEMGGFGASITDSSAYVLRRDMSRGRRAAVLKSLFDRQTGIGLNYLREPIGGSDFSLGSYTEDDLPPGVTDPTLSHFSIAHDLRWMVPVLRQALAINPAIKIIATAWSAPGWMKTTGSLIGGTLQPDFLDTYAMYLTRFVRAYARHGIRVDALTLGNEPDFSPASYAGMQLSPDQEAALAPRLAADLAAAGLHTQILGFDSNWANAAYALALMNAPAAAQALSGIAFHCYFGDPSAQALVHAAFPDKTIYETECTEFQEYPSFGTNLVNGTRTLAIDSVRNWSSTVMLWNAVLDQHDGPTNAGCMDCTPLVAVNSRNHRTTRESGYYVLGQLSRFLAPGAHRIWSTSPVGDLQSVAFRNPNGSLVLEVLNPANRRRTFSVGWSGRAFTTSLSGTSVATYMWAPEVGK
jgi:glucosylceramidase